jgi:hypothetical protein
MSTRSKAIDLKEKRPYLTLPAIAKELGVTKQRIFYILKTAGVPTKGLYQRKKLVYCPVCNSPTPNKQQVCPGKCKDDIKFIAVECEFCHLKFKRKKRIVKGGYKRGYLHIFCSTSCYNRGQRDGITGKRSI